MTLLPTHLRSRLSSLGIRERLVLLVLAMLLPWIALFASTFASYDRDRDRDTRARLGDLAMQVGARVDDQLGTIDGILLAVGQGASFEATGPAANDAFLQRLRAELPPYISGVAL